MATRHLGSVSTLQYVSPGPATSTIFHFVATKIIPCISVESFSSIMTLSGRSLYSWLIFGVFLIQSLQSDRVFSE